MLILSIVSSVALAVTFLIVRQFEQGTDVRKAIEAQDIADTGVEKILYEVKSARSDSANLFVNGLKTRYVCDDPSNDGILENGEFCVDQEASFEYETELQTSLKENETVALDLYDPSDPSGTEVTAIQLSGSADADAWLEVSWVGWTVEDESFSYIASTTKEYFKASEINPSNPSDPLKKIIFKKTYDLLPTGEYSSVYYLNNPFVTGTTDVGQCTSDPLESEGCFTTTSATPINYIVRIKALFGNVPDLNVVAYTDCIAKEGCTSPTSVALPARVAVKVIGRTDKVLQAIQLSIPWKYSLAGLYDYALLSESSLTKEVSVNPGFYSTGTIQAEQGISAASYSASATPNTPPNTPFQCNGAPTLCTGWAVVNQNSGTNNATQNVRCQLEPDLDASNGATCGFDDGQDGRIAYDLSSYDLGDDPMVGVVKTRKAYYLNYRVRVTSQSTDEAMGVYACDSDDTCTNLDGSNIDEASTLYGGSNTPAYLNRGADGWLTCSSLMYLSSDDTLQFRANPDYLTAEDEVTPRLDWFNISTIAFVGQNNCTFAPWVYSTDSYKFEVEAKMAAGETCNGVLCDNQLKWLGYHRLAFSGALITTTFSCDKTAGSCSMQSSNSSLGPEVGFTYPLQYEVSSGVYSPKIAEGDYYVTVNAPLLRLNAGSVNQNDNFIFDIGNFNENAGSYTTYSTTYLPNTNYLNMYRAQGPFPIGGGAGIAINCVLPKQMRVLSGNAASISVSDSNSGLVPTLTIDSFTLSHTYPKDASGSNLPLCPMLSGTPSAQFVQPLTGEYFAPIISPGNANYIKVNAEASQGSTEIDHVEVHAINQSTGTDISLGSDVGINPFTFEWPHDASWNPTNADGVYKFTAVAVDADGLSTYPPTTVTDVTIDTVKPNVSATFTENGGVISIAATATDSNGISYVYVYSAGEKRVIKSCSPAYLTPFTCNMSFTPTVLPWNGHQFQVTAVDRAGNTQTVFYY